MNEKIKELQQLISQHHKFQSQTENEANKLETISSTPKRIQNPQVIRYIQQDGLPNTNHQDVHYHQTKQTGQAKPNFIQQNLINFGQESQQQQNGMKLAIFSPRISMQLESNYHRQKRQLTPNKIYKINYLFFFPIVPILEFIYFFLFTYLLVLIKINKFIYKYDYVHQNLTQEFAIVLNDMLCVLDLLCVFLFSFRNIIQDNQDHDIYNLYFRNFESVQVHCVLKMLCQFIIHHQNEATNPIINQIIIIMKNC
ncbi:hypothetical protein pb186bvf_009738 [Paramecium bursaria]